MFFTRNLNKPTLFCQISATVRAHSAALKHKMENPERRPQGPKGALYVNADCTKGRVM